MTERSFWVAARTLEVLAGLALFIAPMAVYRELAADNLFGALIAGALWGSIFGSYRGTLMGAKSQ